MLKISYIYQLTQVEINELKEISLNLIDTIKWINEKLQEAFNEGRKHPIKEDK